uniref:Uncharacterized protein n=1 Tax=Rhizophora mucronata TaxID=61149 RepID=A0A2P2MT32_RHIMU
MTQGPPYCEVVSAMIPAVPIWQSSYIPLCPQFTNACLSCP